MHELRDKGNTLLVVEHEESIIRAADNVLDIGPGRGESGGELVYNGPLGDFLGSAGAPPAVSRASRDTSREGKVRDGGGAIASGRGACAPQSDGRPARSLESLTRDYLTGKKSIPTPKTRRKSSAALKIKGASEHNLKNIDIEIPLGIFTCVTGVSGSGKSTLIHEVLYQNLLRARGLAGDEAGACKSVTGAHRVGEIVMVDQSPLARTPRQTPNLYLRL